MSRRRRWHVGALVCWLVFPLYLSAQESTAGLQPGEWYVRLVAEANGELKDGANVLGQLHASVAGPDRHDLKELNPFSSPYLTVVFAHEEWGERSGDYASDYRGVSGGPVSWAFEVRSDDPTREVTLSWDATERKRLMSMTLVDERNGKRIPAVESGILGLTHTVGFRETIAPGHHTFNMSGQTVRRFRWEYHPAGTALGDRADSSTLEGGASHQAAERNGDDAESTVEALSPDSGSASADNVPHDMRVPGHLGGPPRAQ